MKTQLIDEAFNRCRAEGRAALVAYITAGDPDFERSLELAERIARSGADILELGLPFSDPLADGEANQNASARALAAGIDTGKVLKLVSGLKAKLPKLPVVLYTYLNPVAYAGSGDFKAFCEKAVASGVDAILPLDLPPEEAPAYVPAIEAAGLGVVSLVAPTTPEERVGRIVANASAFVYYVCQEGVTGERKEFAKGVDERVAMIRRHTARPIVVGFGISTPSHVSEAASSGVDGVVVGSAIVRRIEALSKGECDGAAIGSFVASLAGALKRAK